MRASLVFTLLLGMGLVLPAAAENAATPRPPRFIESLLRQEKTLDKLLARAGESFIGQDVDGDGRITPSDAALLSRISRAAMTARAIGDALAHDLDGDGAVTAAEIRLTVTYQARGRDADRVERRIREIMAADADGDGRVTAAEIASKTASPTPPGQDTTPSATLNLFLGRDIDTPVSRDDLIAAIRDIFTAIDTDGDGVIAPAEFETAQKSWNERDRLLAEEKRRREQEAAYAAKCPFPKPSERADVILVSAYRGAGVSTVAIGSQDDAVTTAAIDIEPGDTPLYLVLAAHDALIWRFAGHTERLERVVLSGYAAAGAVGIPAEKADFLRASDCIAAFRSYPSADAAMAVAALRKAIGKEPAVAAQEALAQVVLPSGRLGAGPAEAADVLFFRKPSGMLTVRGANVTVDFGSHDLADRFRALYPAGVVDIDPTAVVALRPAVSYEVLPGAAGLLQLEESGAIAWDRVAREFQIKRKIRFPAGLFGGLAQKFLVLAGVPKPDGKPGHSCVISQTTGEMYDPAYLCRGPVQTFKPAR